MKRRSTKSVQETGQKTSSRPTVTTLTSQAATYADSIEYNWIKCGAESGLGSLNFFHTLLSDNNTNNSIKLD